MTVPKKLPKEIMIIFPLKSKKEQSDFFNFLKTYSSQIIVPVLKE
jgi:hypothetical protein